MGQAVTPPDPHRQIGRLLLPPLAVAAGDTVTPGPCLHRQLQPRLSRKIVFLASRRIRAEEPVVLLDPAAARDQLAALVPVIERCWARAQPIRSPPRPGDRPGRAAGQCRRGTPLIARAIAAG